MVSIIVPFLDKGEYTIQLIESFKRTNAGCDYEIIFVDNASTDLSAREYLSDKENLIRNDGKQIDGHLIVNDENKGYSIANNQGVSIADRKSKYLCFLNNDITVTDNWLGEMVRCMEEHDKASVVGSKLLYPGTGQIQHAGVKEQTDFFPVHLYMKEDKDYPQANIEKKMFAVTGACMLIDKDVFNEVHGFDEDYWCGWEDIDLCNKVKKLGDEIWYTPKSVLYHYCGMTEGRQDGESGNFNLYMKKWVLDVDKVL